MASPFTLSDWQHPEHTIQLCSHVAHRGAQDWQQLAGQICCQPGHCALKWHVLQLRHLKPGAGASKAYTEWELCVLYSVTGTAACNTASGALLAGKAMLAELSRWLPGRTAEGLRQAYAHNIAGHEAEFLAKLNAKGWRSDTTSLLAAWPGPSAQIQAVLDADGIEGQKAAAAQTLQELSAWAPIVKKQKLTADARPSAFASQSLPAAGVSHRSTLRHASSLMLDAVGSSLEDMPAFADFEQQLQLPRAHSQPVLLGQQQGFVLGLGASAGMAPSAFADTQYAAYNSAALQA